MTRLRTQTACYENAVRDLRLHKLAKPADVTDADRFPNIAAAIASMTDEERRAADEEWEKL